MDSILVVVEAPTPEQSALASRALAEALSKKPALFRSVEEEGGGPFFAKNCFLFLPLDQVKGTMTKLTQAAPLIKMLVRDPSLRGLSHTLIMGLRGAQSQGYPLEAAAPMLDSVAKTLESVAASQASVFSWETLVSSETQAISTRRLISVQPVLFTDEVEPGAQSERRDYENGGPIKACRGATGAGPVDRSRARARRRIRESQRGSGSQRRNHRRNRAVDSLAGVSLVATRAGGGGHACHWSADNRQPSVFDRRRLEFRFQQLSQCSSLAWARISPCSSTCGTEHSGTRAAISARRCARRSSGWASRSLWPRPRRRPAFCHLRRQPIRVLRSSAGSQALECSSPIWRLFCWLPALMTVVNPPDEPKQINQPWLAPIDHFLQRRRAWVIGLFVLLTLAGAILVAVYPVRFQPGASRKQPIAGGFDLSSAEPRSPHGCKRGGGIGALSRGGKADRGET